MSDLIPFTYHNHAIRTAQHDDGSTWWVAADVCTILALRNVSEACSRLDDDEKGIQLVDTPGGPQELLIVNEPGLYRLITRSRKKEATDFRRWVFHEVLPQIRKTGSYGQPSTPAVINPEHQLMIDMIVRIDQNEQRALLAEAAAARAESKADMALDAQQFLTVAEYVYINQLQHQLPTSAYKACSDHLRLYCMDHRIPFRKIPVGGHRWSDEYGYPVSVYADVFSGWLLRRNGQRMLPDVYADDWDPRDA
jgi:prophage antirepressor-like protein